MTVFESIKTKNIDELVDWFNEHCDFDSAPWWKWWDKNYCNNCKSEVGHISEIGREMEFAWCELHDNCKFFKDMDNIPNTKQIIKMWLMSEIK